jgi:CheY-like chemotaxis protein
VGRALIVDDNATNRLVLSTLLESLGLQCELAVSGVEAVNACDGGAWDAIFMDIHMPEMDGMAATRAIRKREAREGRARTPIIAVTASVRPEDVVRYDAAGMDAVVPKPVSLDALADAIVRVLSMRETAPYEAVAGPRIVTA